MRIGNTESHRVTTANHYRPLTEVRFFLSDMNSGEDYPLIGVHNWPDAFLALSEVRADLASGRDPGLLVPPRPDANLRLHCPRSAAARRALAAHQLTTQEIVDGFFSNLPESSPGSSEASSNLPPGEFPAPGLFPPNFLALVADRLFAQTNAGRDALGWIVIGVVAGLFFGKALWPDGYDLLLNHPLDILKGLFQ